MPAPSASGSPKTDSSRSAASKRRTSSRSASGPVKPSSPNRSIRHESPTKSKSLSSAYKRRDVSPTRKQRSNASLKESGHSRTSVARSERAARRASSINRASVVDGTKANRSSKGGKGSKRSNRPGQVSAFLKSTHRNLKEQIDTIQKQIQFIQNLATMKEEKKVDVLFTMIDRDGGGSIDAEELATAMRQNDELSFSDSIEKAIDMVATFDTDGDGELDKFEFQKYVVVMVAELGVTASNFAELLVVQLLLTQEAPELQEAGDLAREQITDEVKKRKKLFGILNNDRVKALFDMMDSDNTGSIVFQTVAKGLYQSVLQTSDDSAQEAMEVLLMIDKNDTRTLDYEEFGRLIMSVSKTAKQSLNDVADGLTVALENQDVWEDDYGADLLMEHTESGDSDGCRDKDNELIDDLTLARLKKLFKLWDADGDGDISTAELTAGLDVFQKASGISVDATAMAEALLSFDEDGDNQLDPKEFAQAMVQYAKNFGVEIHALIDFMCLSSSVGDSSEMKMFQEDFGAKPKTMIESTKSSSTKTSTKSDVDVWTNKNFESTEDHFIQDADWTSAEWTEDVTESGVDFWE